MGHDQVDRAGRLGHGASIATAAIPAQPPPASGGEPLPVSVVIPAFNRAEMLERALASVAAQTPRPPLEVIVVDDCSTDETGEVARRWGAQVIRHDENQGEAAARNTGLAAAGEDWVALLDSDDEWLPHLLATLWPLRGGHQLVAGASLACRPGDPVVTFQGTVTPRPVVLRSPRSLIFPCNFIGVSGAMVRRDAALAAGGYRVGLQQGADLDLWIRLLERGTGIVSPRAVALYHVHPGQVTQNAPAMWSGHQRVAQTYADRPWWRERTLRRWQGGQAWDALRAALRARDAGAAGREALRAVSDVDRLTGLLGLLVWRWASRRRAAAVTRDGAGAPTSSSSSSAWSSGLGASPRGRP